MICHGSLAIDSCVRIRPARKQATSGLPRQLEPLHQEMKFRQTCTQKGGARRTGRVTFCFCSLFFCVWIRASSSTVMKRSSNNSTLKQQGSPVKSDESDVDVQPLDEYIWMVFYARRESDRGPSLHRGRKKSACDRPDWPRTESRGTDPQLVRNQKLGPRRGETHMEGKGNPREVFKTLRSSPAEVLQGAASRQQRRRSSPVAPGKTDQGHECRLASACETPLTLRSRDAHRHHTPVGHSHQDSHTQHRTDHGQGEQGSFREHRCLSGIFRRQLVNRSFSVTQCFAALPSAWNLLSADMPCTDLVLFLILGMGLLAHLHVGPDSPRDER